MATLNILVVDDEQIVALDIRRTLERLGYTVSAIVPDGPTAISKASELQPNLVLMDIRLKGEMDGIQAASIITGKLRIPVIYLTAYSDSATLERAKASNPFGFLIKPFDERELHSTIEIALLKHSAERRLDEARRKAEQENLAKSGYFADMSHEIRNSLNGIIGMTDLALDTDLSSDQRDYLTTALESAENLLSILNDVLDISRIEAHRLALAEKPFDLEDVITKALRTVRPDADRKSIPLSCRISPDAPRRLRGDPGRLRQILLNLLGNALKFTHAGSIDIEVNWIRSALTPFRPDGTPPPMQNVHLLFSVRDTGIGIPEDRQATIFERYRQVDRDTPHEQVGSGLGLAICKDLVEMMDGKIWVRSRVDQGSSFYFTANFIPAAVMEAAPQESHPVQPPERLLHVLAADDNLVSRRLVRMLLEKRGHTCVTASNGLEMLAHLGQEQFDLVLTNIQMPRMGGLEAVRKIRAGLVDGVLPDIPIIAITAHALKGDRERFLEAGMTDYIAKPLHTEQFYRVLERVFRNERQTQEEVLPYSHGEERLLLLDTNGVLLRMQGDIDLVREIWQAFRADAKDQMRHIREVLRGTQARLDLALTEVGLGNALALQTAARNVGAMALCAEAEHCTEALRYGERERAARAVERLESMLMQTLSIMDTSSKTLAEPLPEIMPEPVAKPGP